MSDRNQGSKPWYSNKDLFEMLTNIRMENQQLTNEMKATRRIIKKYNGLYDKVATVKKEIDDIKSMQEGKKSVGESIRLWGGWIFGLITLLMLLANNLL